MSDQVFFGTKSSQISDDLNMTGIIKVGKKNDFCQIFHFSNFLPLDGVGALLIK